MAVDTGSRFNFAAQGVPGVAANADIYATDATPKFALGYKIETADGRVYRYAHFGADTTTGVVTSLDISESSVAINHWTTVAPASAQTTTDGTVGSHYIEVTTSSVTQNYFAGSTLVIADNTGEGHAYRILGNTATGDPASGNIRVTLEEPLAQTLSATSDLLVVGSRWANLEAASTTDDTLAGVTTVAVTSSTAPYGWVQTKGIGAVLQGGTIASGDLVSLSDATAGAVETFATTGTTQLIVGRCVGISTSGGYAAVDLSLE